MDIAIMIPDNYRNNYIGRYPQLKSRLGVWREIVRFVEKDAGQADTLLELGAGYCDFVNQFPARRKIAYDINPEMLKFADENVEMHIGDVSTSGCLEKEFSVDLVFASNFLEHLDRDELDKVIPKIKMVLKPGGRLILIQPNYDLFPDRYFDDPTHKTIFSDKNIKPFLNSFGFSVIKLIPGLLPFSMKSRLPKLPILIRLYLMSPVRPMAGQMYVVAERS